jgi:hypothetical protein
VTDDKPPRPYRSATALGLESRKPDRAGTQSDGTPRAVDNDKTPPPARVPDDVSAMTLAERVTTALEVGAQNSRAIAYEQDQRNEARRHGEAIATLTKTMERIEPALVKAHETAALADDMRRDVRDTKANVMSLIESQARDDERHKASVEQFDRVLKSIGAVDASARKSEAAVGVLAARADGYDKLHAESQAKHASTDTKLAALDKRHAITRARLGRGDKALVGGLGATAGVIGHYVSDLFTWLASHFH